MTEYTLRMSEVEVDRYRMMGGAGSDDDIARWEAAFARSDANPQPNFLFGCIYTVTARRP